MYLDNRFLHINISNPRKSLNELKEIFKPLKLRFMFGTNLYHPFIYCPKPTPILIRSCDVCWKDKWNTPRYECPPYIWIYLFGLEFVWYWTLPPHQYQDVEDYWEQALWYLHYYNTYSQGLLDKPNIKKAKESWPWKDYETKESTWNDKFLIK